MLPKTSKELIKQTTEELNLDEELVNDIITFYYSEVRNCLRDLEHYNIQVSYVGTFKIKKNKLRQLFIKYKKHLAVLTKNTFGQMQIRKDLNDRMAKAWRVQIMLNDENLRKEKFLKAKQNGFKKDLEI